MRTVLFCPGDGRIPIYYGLFEGTSHATMWLRHVHLEKYECRNSKNREPDHQIFNVDEPIYINGIETYR